MQILFLLQGVILFTMEFIREHFLSTYVLVLAYGIWTCRRRGVVVESRLPANFPVPVNINKFQGQTQSGRKSSEALLLAQSARRWLLGQVAVQSQLLA